MRLKTNKINNIKRVNKLINEQFIKSKLIHENELTDTTKKMIVLVGPPSVGKSTWTNNNFPDAYVISRDDIVDEVASKYGWTYDDMFATPPSDSKIGDNDEKYGTVIEAP